RAAQPGNAAQGVCIREGVSGTIARAPGAWPAGARESWGQSASRRPGPPARLTKSWWQGPHFGDILQDIGNRPVLELSCYPQRRNEVVKREHHSWLALSSLTLALGGMLAAGPDPAHADDLTAGGAAARASALAKSVTIQRDAFGVPHVYGPTDASCVFGFIYAQAEDYFWQIEDSYLRSLGRAAEVYGEKSLPDDLVNRALDITRLYREEDRTVSPKVRAICQAVADGLNYYLAVHPRVKPRLITHFEPWHPLAFRRFILYQSFIYSKSGLKASDILSAVREIDGNK